MHHNRQTRFTAMLDRQGYLYMPAAWPAIIPLMLAAQAPPNTRPMQA
jgi:hypothetical protein